MEIGVKSIFREHGAQYARGVANLYFDEHLLERHPSLNTDDLITIDGDEARHAVRVSRLRAGEHIAVGDGAGAIATGEVIEAEKSRFTVRVENVRHDPAPSQRLVLVQALAKGDRDERAVEQATEFGIDAIVPWQADRSVSRWDGPDTATRTEKGMAKWRRIAREAAKQSMRSWMPEVREPLTLDGLCALAAGGTARLVVLDPRGARKLSEWARTTLDADDAESSLLQSEEASIDRLETMLVIGPEGGFSEAELRRLAESGAHLLQLGEAVLRTSSAGPAALAVLNVALGRW